MTTYRRLYIDGPNGRVAIYDVTTLNADLNNEPLSDPLSYVPRLHFHSDLEYPKVIGTYTGTITLPAVGISSIYTAEYVVAAHGRAGTPYVEGKISVGGVWLPLAGSTIVVQSGPPPVGASTAFGRFLALGANGTNIVIEEYSVSSTAFGSVSFDFEIYLLDTLL